MKCKICKSTKLKKITNLEHQPISSVFLNKKKNNLKKYNINLYNCKNCNLIQFTSLPPLDDMYGHTYGYRTSLSQLMIHHMYQKFLKLKKKIKNEKDINILDIGSNDGTFLNFFSKLKKKTNLVGIDPSAKKFEKYYNKKINLIVNYFSYKNLIKRMKNIHKFDLITSFAMFYDISDPISFCKDIKKLLHKNGLWTLEISYFPLLLKNLTYDQICHEHVIYYTLTTFNNLIKKTGLKIIDCSFNEINGGSIEIICGHKTSNHKSNINKINSIIEDEKNINLKSYENFNNRIENIKKNIVEFLKLVDNQNVIGYGASTKGNIFLNHCNFSSKNIKYVCDANPYKYGKYTPGSNIKIISKEKMRKLNPKYLLVLIWSFRKEVIEQELNYLKKGGKMIFHLPQMHIIDKYNYKHFLKSDFGSLSYNY